MEIALEASPFSFLLLSGGLRLHSMQAFVAWPFGGPLRTGAGDPSGNKDREAGSQPTGPGVSTSSDARETTSTDRARQEISAFSEKVQAGYSKTIPSLGPRSGLSGFEVARGGAAGWCRPLERRVALQGTIWLLRCSRSSHPF